jgi:hypothetical protein
VVALGELIDFRAIERLGNLRSLVISTKRRELAHAVAKLDLSAFPELHTLSLSCWAPNVQAPIGIDTSWVPRAPWLRYLDLKGFAPANGSFEDIMAASRLVYLTITAPDADLQAVKRALPLTSLRRHRMDVRAPDDTFGMFSAEGEDAVAAMVHDLTDGLAETAMPRAAALNRRLAEAMQAISDAGHGEIFDTDVRDRLSEALENPSRALGWTPTSSTSSEPSQPSLPPWTMRSPCQPRTSAASA